MQTKYIIKEYNQVNILEYPKQIEGIQNGELTIGDIHANALFLMHFLVANEAVSIEKEAFERLVELYTDCYMDTSNGGESIYFDRDKLEEFNSIIDSLKVNSKISVRLIGDELFDSGECDFFILKIIDKLKQSGMKLEILYSNHSSNFLFCYEQDFENMESDLGSISADHPGMDKGREPLQSFETLNRWLKQGLLKKEEVVTLVERSYLPSLKLISYTLKKDCLFVCSHAPIGLEAIKALAEKFKVEYKDGDAKELAQTIDAINLAFSEYVKKKNVHTLIADPINCICSPNEDPVTFVAWNKGFNEVPAGYTGLKRPLKLGNDDLYFIHGHVTIGKEYLPDNAICLDNESFKRDCSPGNYLVISIDPTKDLTLENMNTEANNDLDNNNLSPVKYHNNSFFSHPYSGNTNPAKSVIDTSNEAELDWQLDNNIPLPM